MAFRSASAEDGEMTRRANALNRCAIARCAGSLTASTATGVEIVDSVRVVLS